MHHVHLGYSPYRASPESYGLFQADRRRHVYLLGKSGVGKTSLMLSMIAEDMAAGQGVGVIDPHGELAEAVLRLVPSWRTGEVVYFNPGDASHPIGFNPLEKVRDEEVALAALGVVSAFKGIWADSWGPRLEYILANCLAALIPARDTTLLSLPRLLTDKPFRTRILAQVRDPLVKQFFVTEYDRYPERLRLEAIAPLQNKVGAMLFSRPLRYVLGQARNRPDFSKIMQGQIFVANLAKGRIGPRTSELLGALLLSAFEMAALRRVIWKEEKRRDFNLFVDEFPSFATDAMLTLLSESRKFGLCLHLAHQYLEQLTPSLRAAVFGNVGTLIAFGVGERDAPALARELYPEFREDDLLALGRGEVILKRSVGGETLKPVRAYTYHPEEGSEARLRAVMRASRRRYGTPRRVVEARLKKALA